MSTPKYDGGPAFPVPPGITTFTGDPRDGAGYELSQEGMTLRDYFAAKAMSAYIGYVSASGCSLGRAHKEVAEESYLIADAMLAARKEDA